MLLLSVLPTASTSHEGDTSFPAWDESEWQLISREAYEQGEKYPHPFAFEIYDRIK